MNTAIIVAAGSSTRFAAAQPKQFFPILGKPLIIYTLEKFDGAEVIDNIVLVLSDEGISEFSNLSDRFPIGKLSMVVKGGATRAESVRNGLNAVDPATACIVAIHDGARPLVTADEITRTLEKASETGAACLVASVTDTIKETDPDGSIVRTLDRNILRRALTPQAFRYDLIRKALDSGELAEHITDESYLIENLGIPIATVEGSVWNIKVTHPEDILVAEKLLNKD
jgi:2-C-methyl-D-erythritol 4-phosphate cytidylyltransferase